MTRSISDAYLHGDARIRELFAFSPDQWEEVIAGRLEFPRTSAVSSLLVAQLIDYNKRCGARDNVIHNIQRFKKPDTVCVVTGQQPGLLGGPLYNLYKALTAVALAENLSERFKINAVPIFWIASDDHDFEEVRHFSWLSSRDEINRASYTPSHYRPGCPLFQIPILRERFDDILSQIRETTPTTDFKSDILSLLEECVENSSNFEEHFVRIMNRLLSDRGLIFVPPHLPELRRLSLSVVLNELEQPGESSRIIMEAAEMIKQAGFKPTLYRKPGQVNFFVLEYPSGASSPALRARIDFTDGHFHLSSADTGESINTMNPDDLISYIQSEPQRISLNVLSRPLVQDAIFPTVAYVGGPGEINYFAQLKNVYTHFSIFMPIIFPRVHILLIEPRIKRLLDNYKIEPSSLMEEEMADVAPLVRNNLPESGTETAIDAVFKDVMQELQHLSGELEHVRDTGVKNSIYKLISGVEIGFDKLRERYNAYNLERSELITKHIEKLNSSLFPNEQPQERVFSPFFPFMLKFGNGFMEQLQESFDPFQFSRIIHLQGKT